MRISFVKLILIFNNKSKLSIFINLHKEPSKLTHSRLAGLDHGSSPNLAEAGPSHTRKSEKATGSGNTAKTTPCNFGGKKTYKCKLFKKIKIIPNEMTFKSSQCLTF